MSGSVHIASLLLEQDRRTLAELILPRLESTLSGDQLENPLDWRNRIETHLQTTAACIKFASPLLLADYVRWGGVSPDPHPPFANEIRTVLEMLADVARSELPSDVSTVVSRYVEAALATEPSEPPPSPTTASSVQQDYLSALLTTDRAKALRLAMDAVESGMHVRDFYLDVLQPTQRQIGVLWQSGQITVAQEHYCTAATQFIMSHLQPYFLRKEQCDKAIVAACVGDELHEVGLRIVSDVFEMNGWDSVYLGANLPADSIVATLVDRRAHVLAVSTTMTRHLLALGDLIPVVRSSSDCEHVRILVGGYPFNIDPFLWRRMGADAGATDANDAVRMANSLISQEPTAKRTPSDDITKPTFAKARFTDDSTTPAYDDLSRLNNELITAQRELHKANTQLRGLVALNEQQATALKEADRRKDEFLAMLAHELRNPLEPMSHAAAILGMDNVEDSIATEARETIQRQIKHMARLIGDLLDASRIAHGKIHLQMERVTLSDVVARAVEIAQPTICDKRHELTVSHSETPIVLFADEIRLTQVISNLLTNAAKYTDDEGKISISTKLAGDQAIIEVHDNGIGIDPNVLPRLFDTFAQDERGREYARGGLGIGLSLVKQLVELHQGAVDAQSEGEGTGCTITVSLPALEEPGEEQDAESGDTDAAVVAPSESRSVLIVDDTPAIAKITARLFQMLGHEPAVASDGDSAIERYQAVNPEIVVLDLMLPDMSGFDVAKEIRRLDVDDRTLIVALTGNSDDEYRQRAVEAGFDEFLVKPVDIGALQKLGSHQKLFRVNGTH